ncbi:hypothetical protein HFP15_21295 [Amycolatopsis sp. K13G38]|uniref:Uncharacterized protein n=1 Tax=Amycolatopsis acididurans TaxID=2724524 RepID=A0ABX1J6N7_9PSEU|nr:hypothetical protein [Amycolatopsis acididurans]NKQ55423.1 hypothetical protein [Amycolatopsis acididurans]
MEVWHTPKQSWVALVLGVLIRWRAEIVLVAVLVTARVWLGNEVGGVYAWLIMAGAVVLVLLVPQTRWFVWSRFWCLVDRHRLRTCLRQARARTMNLDGALPFMLWSRPTKTGERIWMWSRAGSSSGDLEAALEYIAPACYARDARVYKVRKLSTLFAVDVVRRDPLDRSTPIDSPLAKIGSLFGGKTAGEGAEPITGATITPLPVNRNASSEAKPVSGKTTTAAKPSEAAVKPVVVNGEDLSDYID